MSPVETIVANPFPGLRPFHEEEEYLFFGRESQVHAMVDTLGSTRFLAVVGPSGSGKSSLVNCGLRPALRRGLMTSAGTAWRMVQFRPGSRPLEAMAHALADEGVLFFGKSSDDLSMDMLVELDLRMSRRGLVEIYKQAHVPEHVNLLMVVDQFEELFRFGSVDDYVTRRKYGTDEKARAFVSLLLESAAQREHPIFLVLTMRSDFLGDCAEFPDLSEAINTGLFLVPRMKRYERREAIAGPVAVGGAEISPVLLTRLVNDVGDNPDQLSILQHALNRTWSRWEHEGGGEGPLDLPHYEAIGTMARALDQHAEKAYAELGGERQQYICEKIFKALTDKGTDPRGIRRPTKLGTLCALSEADEEEVVEVIDVFRKPSRSFLMPPLPEVLTADTVIDISHESFMRVWDRLKRWADEEVASARMYGRLADAAVRYRAGQVGLLRDPELQLALDWREANHPTAAWASLHRGVYPATMRFLDESHEQREKEIRDEAERRQRELEQARALADARGRAARRLWVGFIVAAVFAVAAAVSGGLALIEKAKAENQAFWAGIAAIEAEVEKIKADASAATAELARIEADSSAKRAEVEKIKADASAATAELARIDADTSAARAEREKIKADVLAATAEQARIDADTSAARADRLRDDALRASMQVVSLALANKARRRHELAEVEVRALLAQEALNFHEKGKGEFFSEVFDALRLNLNELMKSASSESSLRYSQALTKTRANPFAVRHPDAVRALALRGSQIASASSSGIVYLWGADDPTGDVSGQDTGVEARLHSVGRPVRSVEFSPDGSRMASAGDDGRVLLWDSAGKTQTLERDKDSRSPVLTLAFSPDGNQVAFGQRDGNVVLSDGHSLEVIRRYSNGNNVAAKAVAFSRDGVFLLSGGADGLIRWWDLREEDASVDRVLNSGHSLNDLAISRDGRLLATAGVDGIVRVWNAQGDSLFILRGHAGAVNAVVFSDDAKTIASAGADGSVRLWTTDRGPDRNDMVLADADRSQWVMDVVFSPSGDSLFSAGADRKVLIWRLDAESLRRDLCKRLRRDLREDEWKTYVVGGFNYAERDSSCASKEGTEQ